MKLVLTLLGGLMLAASIQATAEFTTVDRAYEVPFEHLRMPESVNGQLAFKQCDDCELMQVDTVPGTRYLINDEALDLADFRLLMFRARSEALRAGNVVTVLHNLETDTIVSVSVYL